jgi:hypothetical protein
MKSSINSLLYFYRITIIRVMQLKQTPEKFPRGLFYVDSISNLAVLFTVLFRFFS